MCGRYSLVATVDKIEKQLGIKLKSTIPLVNNYNIAPVQHGAIITNDAPNQVQSFRWGLVPHWAKASNKSGALINARSEGIDQKPSFRTPIRKQRCLVLADSFYEWKKSGGQKYPYRIMLKSENIMAMAGVWEEWRMNNEYLQTFSIITAAANAEVSSLHSRMPIIFTTKNARDKWLSELPLTEVLSMLEQPVDGILKSYRISQKVNSVSYDKPEIHKEVRDDLLTLF